MGLFERFRAAAGDEAGASAVEYAVLGALVIAVCVFVIAVFGEQVRAAFSAFVDAFAPYMGKG